MHVGQGAHSGAHVGQLGCVLVHLDSSNKTDFKIKLASRCRFPILPEDFLHYYTMTLQQIRNILQSKTQDSNTGLLSQVFGALPRGQ